MNNKGWGLTSMLAILAVMALALILSIFLYYRYFGDSGFVDPHGSEYVSYSDFERTVNQAFKKYVEDHYNPANEDISVTTSTLQSAGYLGAIKANNINCHGYGLYRGSNKSYNSYIKCGLLYTSAGYNSKYE